jgi:Domain of unknown function (DUF1911)/Domain of unknown function (DUF1910)
MAAEWHVRAPLGAYKYWETCTDRRAAAIEASWVRIAKPPGDLTYRPQFLMEQAHLHREQMLYLYSAGAPIAMLAFWFDGLLRAWEAARELEPTVYGPDTLLTRRTWAVNLDLYINCFWLVGLALALNIPDEQWQRLVALIGNEGQDAVMDRVIATRQPGRRIGENVLFPKPYSRLMAALVAPAPEQAALLREFVEHWYKGRAAIYNRPYWYRFGDENFEGGAYFGRWCIEAVAAAKAFGLDDTSCCGHEHYPGDLLRPEGPRTHTLPPPPKPELMRPWWKRWLGV